MMTMEEIRNIKNTEEMNKQKLTADIKDLSERSAQIDNELTLAAEAGNVSKYASLKAEKEMVAESIRVKRQRLTDSRLSFDKRDEVLSGWRKYTSKFNAEFAAKLTKYEAAKRTLAKEYMALVEMQRQALVDQQMVNGIVNRDKMKVSVYLTDAEMEKLELMPKPSYLYKTQYEGKDSAADVAAFAESGCISRETAAAANAILLHNVPVYSPIQ